MATRRMLIATVLTFLYSSISAQSCEDQSCEIADISGSTGIPYTGGLANFPTGGTASGDQCIASYASEGAYTGPFPPSLRFARRSQKAWQGIELMQRATAEARTTSDASELQKRQRGCLPYTLIYSRGTSESGTLGETVGPALQAGLDLAAPGKWSIQGVPYQATVDGDDCLGLPGGVIATDLIESVASECPNTKIVVSGYSEGAMVSHNGVGNSNASAKSKIAAVVVFGDPFNGAPIKGYSGPIKTYCAAGDDVCDGEFVITAAHLSYVGVDTTEAVAYIQSVVS
ncbi:MAG: hypothetical protein M1821_001812 [Bathelium mastoideum]|nr:MAG: hypothetical protein M1821_001812 [Bathelium mastoideum]